MLEFSDGQLESETEILQHFIAMQVEGVVIFSGLLSQRSSSFRNLQQAGIPVVLIDPCAPSSRGTVWIDRAAAIAKVTKHLVQLGHRRFAALGIDPLSYYGTMRSQALEENLAPPHVPGGASLLNFFEPKAWQMDFEYGWRLAERVLAESKRPTALIALSDRVAFGAMEFLKRHKFRVPHDFSIVGYDNSDLSTFAVPALTTVDPQVDLLIEHGVKMLLHDIAKAKGPQKASQRIEPRLVVRSSTAPPPR